MKPIWVAEHVDFEMVAIHRLVELVHLLGVVAEGAEVLVEGRDRRLVCHAVHQVVRLQATLNNLPGLLPGREEHDLCTGDNIIRRVDPAGADYIDSVAHDDVGLLCVARGLVGNGGGRGGCGGCGLIHLDWREGVRA